MAKLLTLLTISLLIGISLAHSRNPNPWYYRIFQPFFTPTSICFNGTTQQAYLAKTLTLISSFQANATYSTIMQEQSPNFIAYIRNPANQGLLYSNCSAFITGVKAAKSADQNIQRARQQIRADIYQRFRQVPRDVTGSNRPNELDDNDIRGYCF